MVSLWYSVTFGLVACIGLSDQKKVVKVGMGQIGQNLINGKSIMSTDYLNQTLEEEAPPSEFHTPKSKLTNVKDQGVCNACGIFAQIAAIETGMLIQNSLLVNSELDLSEQALLNCFVEKEGDDGCEGVRNISAIMEYIINERNGSLPLECHYPYKQKQEKEECPPLTKNYFSGVQVTDYYCFEHVGEEGLMALVARHGAVVVAIVDDTRMEKYKGGVFDECSDGGELNHAVTIVGYGEWNGKKYWDVKNSHGKDWGEDGYVRIERGINCCRIEESALVPILTRTNSEEHSMGCTSVGKTYGRILCPISIIILIAVVIIICMVILACIFCPTAVKKRGCYSPARTNSLSDDSHPNSSS